MNVIQPELFSKYPEVRCGVSSRKGGVSPKPFDLNLSFSVGDNAENVKENRNRFFGALGIRQESVGFPKQVHGNVVRCVEKPGMYEGCDALVANASGLFLAISVADCLPIFLFDPETKSIASVHSGWRGSKMKIVSNAVKVMNEEFGTYPEDLLAFIGPSAGACCYEVGEEVAMEFKEKYVEKKSGRKPHLDLKAFNTGLLIEAGVSENNIEVSEYCTICHADLFHSYRRDKENSGRM